VQQHVPAAEHPHEEEVDDVGLADDHAADFLPDPLPGIDEPANGRNVLVHRLAVGINRRGACGFGFGSRHREFLF
jgi:hypothetical protein